jgi:hypothetical protein
MVADRIGLIARVVALATAAGLITSCGADSNRSVAAGVGVVDGTVVASPTCPGPVGVGEDCEPRPVETTVDAYVGDSDEPVASAPSDADGRFRLELDPGDYRLEARATSPIGGPVPTPVTVTAAAEVDVTLTIDTGLR